jgi:hypothetical protein
MPSAAEFETSSDYSRVPEVSKRSLVRLQLMNPMEVMLSIPFVLPK